METSQAIHMAILSLANGLQLVASKNAYAFERGDDDDSDADSQQQQEEEEETSSPGVQEVFTGAAAFQDKSDDEDDEPDGVETAALHLFDQALQLVQMTKDSVHDGSAAAAFSLKEHLDAVERGQPRPLETWGNLIASMAHNALGELHYDNAMAQPDNINTQLLSQARTDFENALANWDANVSALMSLSIMSRELGDLDTARSYAERCFEVAQPFWPKIVALAQATEDDDEDEEDEDEDDEKAADVLQVLGVPDMFMKAVPLAAHRLAQYLILAGKFKEATPYLQRFQVRHAISPAVWKETTKSAPASPSSKASKAASTVAPCHMYREALSPALHEALLKGFAPSASYWPENDYDQSEYFSWWYDVSKEPRNVVELAVQQLREHTGLGDKLVGAEWWVHSRQVSGGDIGHQLHFDTDELTLEADGRILHPEVSSVAYLSAGAGGLGGPTVVFEQKVDATEMAGTAHVVHPVEGGFMTFPGDYLHGVLPTAPAASSEDDGKSVEPPSKRARTSTNGSSTATSLSSTTPEKSHRLTLLIGFWTRSDFSGGESATPSESQPGHRARRLVPYDDTDLEWVKELAIPKSLKGQTATHSAATEDPSVVTTVAPAWVDIPEEPSLPFFLDIPHHVDARFFVQSPKDFHQRMMEEHALGHMGEDDESDDSESAGESDEE